MIVMANQTKKAAKVDVLGPEPEKGTPEHEEWLRVQKAHGLDDGPDANDN